MTKPILVCMSWRGGARFERCLTSIASSKHHFSRIVLSITSEPDSDDMRAAKAFQKAHPSVEVICTDRELPTMEHQAFWVTYLENTGATPTDWIYWLAYDDEIRPKGIEAITDEHGSWPLEPDTVYFGPWAMRHEQPDQLWAGNPTEPLESWTSFPIQGPTKLPVLTWIADQLRQPTYMQMSGSIAPLGNFIELRDGRPKKTGPMRIEMTIAASGKTQYVAEFPEPIVIIYGRSDSDRASYGKSARAQDVHLAAWLVRHTHRSPQRLTKALAILMAGGRKQIAQRIRNAPQPTEEWRIRASVDPS